MISFETTYCLPPKTTFRCQTSYSNRVSYSINKRSKLLKIRLTTQLKSNMHCVLSRSSDTAISYYVCNTYWNNEPLFATCCGNPSRYLIWIMREFTPKWIQEHGGGISKYATQKCIFISVCSRRTDTDSCRIHTCSRLIGIGSNICDKFLCRQEIMASLNEHREYKVNCAQQTHNECLDTLHSPPYSTKGSWQNPHIPSRSSRVGCVTDHLRDLKFYSESVLRRQKSVRCRDGMLRWKCTKLRS